MFNKQQLQDTLSSIKTQLFALFAGRSIELAGGVQQAVVSFLSDSEKRLSGLLESFTSIDPDNKVSKEFVAERLKEEPEILVSELKSLAVIAEEISQETMNKIRSIAIEEFLKLVPQA